MELRHATSVGSGSDSGGLVAKIRRSLQRDSNLGLSERLRKAVRFVETATAAAVTLRACDRVGAYARSRGRLIVANRGRIEIGDYFNLNSPFAASQLSTGPEGVLEIGHHMNVNFGVSIAAHRSVKIGDHVMIGPYCLISDVEAPDLPFGDDRFDSKPILIGNHVWLTSRVTVLPGTSIGDGSVITAGSIVSGSIPSGVVAGGIPARVLRKLSPDERSSPMEAFNDTPPTGGTRTDSPALTRPAALDAETIAESPACLADADLCGLVISDFTADVLAHSLSREKGFPTVACEVAPFGQVIQTLMQVGPPGEANQQDFAIVWTRPEAVVPSFQEVTSFRPVAREALLQEVDAFCSLVRKSSQHFRFLFVPSWVTPTCYRGLGVIDLKHDLGTANALVHMNLRLMENLRDVPNVYVLNTQPWIETVGEQAFNPKLWYMGKVAFHGDVFAEAARDIKAALSGLTGNARKLIILDLDDTLWGGVVGDVGWQSLRLGGHDGVGEALVDFQRHLKNLTRRGVLLAIASKNEERVALEAIRSHPEMVLALEDFAGWKISWRDKAQNIAELLAELNLGPQSAVFIDDNPAERARVRESLPEVFVPDWPEDKLLYAGALLSLRCFDTATISKEDVERTQMYVSGRQREELKQQVSSLEDWLQTLAMEVRVEKVHAVNLQRTAQLLNKTNQMNLSTRRLTESELQLWANEPGHTVWALSVTDRFGDAGLTGILSVDVQESALQIIDFVLSCRVMGRKIEDCMVHLAVAEARSRGLDRVVAHFLPTAKNKPCFDFWQNSGFEHDADRGLFTWLTENLYPSPGHIRLEMAP